MPAARTMLLSLLFLTVFGPLAAPAANSNLVILCYHDIPVVNEEDPYAVDVESFIGQVEYLRTHGYTFLSAADVYAAGTGGRPLPPKAVMLTFDDGYATFASNVVPVLRMYGYPAMLALCAKWTETGGPPELTAPLMDWRQVRSVAANPLVTIASHSFDLHKAIPYNPQSNTAHAAVSRAYDRNRPGYETETEYVARLREDFGAAKALFAERLGRVPEFLAWPYGEANAISTGLAGEAGYKMAFLLRNRTASVADLMRIDRWVIAGNPAIQDFIEDLAVRERHGDFPMDPLRGVQVDLDLIYDPSPVQTEKNLGRFLERIATIRPNTVVLQAFADPDGDGNVDAVYFPNRVLPVRADLLNRVANQLYVRGFRVFVWMPVLAVTLPDPRRNASLLVRGRAGEGQASSAPEYRRLSPFAPETETIMATLYDDLAAHVRFDGLLFQDDAFLRDDEDMHPAALAFCGERLGFPVSVPRALTDAQRAQWTRLKTRRLNDLTLKLMQTVRRYRPDTVFARDLYIKPLEMPASEEWFAQNYDDALALYDLVVLMAFPRMEGVRRPLPWLERLADRVAARPRGLEKTVFNLQSYDWRRKRWLSDAELLDQTRTLMARGVRHVVYYPDDYTVNKPAALAVRREYSTTHFLFPKPPEKRTLRRY